VGAAGVAGRVVCGALASTGVVVVVVVVVGGVVGA